MFRKLIKNIRKKSMNPEEYAKYLGVKIGKGCFISTKEFPSEGYLIEIGNYVRVAPQTAFFTHGGIWTLRKIYNDKELEHFGKIKIGDYTYIGERCMIMPGVQIGSNCVIAAGTIVTKNVPDGCMVAGSPCKYIGKTETFYKKLKETEDLQCGKMSKTEKRKYLLSLPDSSFIHKKNIKLPE